MTRVIYGLVVMLTMLTTSQIPVAAQGKPDSQPIELEPVVVRAQREEDAARERRLVPATGTKTETHILDLPISVGVVDKRQIEEQGAASVMEALSNISGVYSFNSFNAFPQYAVRGFFGNNVTLMTNGIKEHENQRGSRDVDLFNLERIEVLKGPASVLYGQGAIGAAVNYVTKQPTTTPAYEGAFSYGSFDTVRGSGGAGGPLVPGRLLYRIDVGASSSGGFEDRTDYERYQGTGTLVLVLPSEGRLTLFMDNRYDEIKPYMGIPVISNRPLRLALVRRENNYNIPDTQNWVYVLRDRVLYEQPLTENLKLRNLLYFFRQELGYRASEEYTFVAPRTLTRTFLEFTRDDYLLGDQLEAIWDTKLWATKHKVLVGLDSSYNRLKSTQATGSVGNIDLFEPVEPGTPERITSRNNRDAEVRSYAAYGQNQIELTEQWKAVLGLRFDHVNGQIRRTNTHESFQRKFDDFSYRAGAVYQPVPTLSLYASYTNATRPTTNLFNVPTDRIFKPEKAEQWETGVKNMLLNNRFVTTLAWFTLDKENIQVTRTLPGGGQVTDQIGKQRSRGFELDVDYLLTRDWRVTGNYTFTDAYFVEFEQSGRNLAGKRPQNIPEQLGSLWTNYDLGAGFGVGTGFRFVGERFGEDSNRTAIPEYFLWDAMLSYRWKGLEGSLNFKNITDVTRFDQALRVGNVTTNLVPGRPFEVIGGLRVGF